jgi:RNA polymerase sigma-70 factor, ECF subfamily
MENNTEQFLNAAISGHRTDGVQLIEQCYARVFAFLRRLTANEADAADLTQRTFTRVWQALPTFAGRSSPSSWIHGIAYHVYVDWRRSERPSEPRSLDWWSSRPAHDPQPDDLVARTDLAQTLYASVDQLEPDLRETIHLHYYQNLTLQETADAMGVASSTVKYRLRLALAQLQRELATEPVPHKTAATSKSL